MSWRNLSGCGLKRAKKAVLVEAYLELSGQAGSDSYAYPSTKDGLLIEIEKLRENEREQMFQRRTIRRASESLCEIPAREVNEWLRSLPV